MSRNLFTITLDDLVAPKQIMKDQGRYLAELSQGTVTAAVETSRGNPTQSDYLVHTFRVFVPALGYSFKLFEVTHSADIYPVKVSSGDWTYERECDNFESFLESVSAILNDPATKKRLESLKCQVLAESGELEARPPLHAIAPSATAEAEADRAPAVASEPAAGAEAVESSSPGNVPLGGTIANWVKVDFDAAHVEQAPAERGGAVIYGENGAAVFVAYSSSDIRSVLQGQLKKGLGSGKTFECGRGESLADVESMVKSRVGGLQFRRLRASSDTAIWP